MKNSLQFQIVQQVSLNEIIGLTVKRVMLDKDVLQKDLAAAVGVSTSTLGRKLSGFVPWSAEDLFRVAMFLDKPVSDFYPNSKNPLPAGKGYVVAGAGFEPTTSGNKF